MSLNRNYYEKYFIFQSINKLNFGFVYINTPKKNQMLNLSVACVIETISAQVNSRNIPLLCVSDTLHECMLSTKQLEFLDTIRDFVIKKRDEPLHQWLHEYSFTSITLFEIQKLLNVDVQLRDAVRVVCDQQDVLQPLILQLHTYMNERDKVESASWNDFVSSYTHV